MFLNIKSKIMKQTQKYRQLSLFDDTEEKKAGTPLDQFEAPDQIQQVGTVRCLEHGEQRPFSGTAEMERGRPGQVRGSVLRPCGQPAQRQGQAKMDKGIFQAVAFFNLNHGKGRNQIAVFPFSVIYPGTEFSSPHPSASRPRSWRISALSGSAYALTALKQCTGPRQASAASWRKCVVRSGR